MARHISVYRLAGGETLYEEPLGSESAVREWWSQPASELGLSLLSSIYEDGFYHGVRWEGDALQRMLEEAAKLERHWVAADLPADVLADLRERVGYLRTALVLAKDCGGFVDIA